MNAEKKIHHTDFLVIGSGIAGLSFALKISNQFPESTVTVITKDEKNECNTKYAQGGISTVWDKTVDSFEKHIEDTLISGDGLCDKTIVDMVITEGPKRLKELMVWGAQFDVDTYGKLDLGKEAIKAVAEEKQVETVVESEVSEELVALEAAEEEVESTITEELVEETDKPKVEAEVAAEETATQAATDEDLVAQAMAEMDALLAGSEPKEEERSEPVIEDVVAQEEVAVKAEELEESEDLVSEFLGLD